MVNLKRRQNLQAIISMGYDNGGYRNFCGFAIL